MSEDATPRFDPRFNPEFQPGYNPGDSAPGAPASAPAQPVTSASRQAGYPATAYPPTSYPAPSPVPGVDPSRGGARRAAAGPAVVSPAPPAAVGAPGTASAPPNEPTVVVSSPTFGASATTEDSAPSLAALARNPFVLALVGIAVALVIVGSWMFAQAYAAFSDTGNFASPADFVALESAMRAAPIVILAGVGVAVSVLFIFARGWRSRR